MAPGRRAGLVVAIVAFVVATTCDPYHPLSLSPSTAPPDARPPPEEDEEVVVVAAGDLVCGTTSPAFAGHDPRECQHRATAKLVPPADAVLVLGDLQYEDGSLGAFTLFYDPTWGRFADITYPTTGNHDYGTPGAEGYFSYWRSKGRPTGRPGQAYYSFDLGAWHLISLDSNCSSCTKGSAQDRFLERDLARTNEECILAFWHHPYFNSGTVHDEERPQVVHGFWRDLYAAGVDVVLHGHEHNYQRYAKQDPAGHSSPRGIRQFVVGTGGRILYALREDPDPNFQAGDDGHFGVLRLTLDQRSYSWEFVATGGAVLDRGGPTPCN